MGNGDKLEAFNKSLFKKLMNRFSSWLVVLVSVVLIGALFLYLIINEINLKSDREAEDFECLSVNSEWILEREDGSTETISLPYTVRDGRTDEVFTISHEMTDQMKKYDYMMIWNKGQLFEVYLDDEFLYAYTMDSEDNVGLDRTFRFVPIKISSTDESSNLVFKFRTVNSNDTGMIGDVYFGNRVSLMMEGITQYQFEIFLALFMFVVGLVSVGAGLFVKYKANDLESFLYAGLCIMVTAMWMVGNSRSRQYIFPNSSVIRDCAFFCVSLIPFAYSMFIDTIQRHRYHVAYAIVIHLSVLVAAVQIVCHFGNIINLSALNPIPLVLNVSLVIIFIITVIMDARKGKLREYIIATAGLSCFGFMGIIQMVLYQIVGATVTSGTYMSIGLMMFSAFALINAVYGVIKVYTEKKQAVAQVKYLSTNTMEALAKTVDAKDRYTAGHSFRVAEYSARMGRKLGWSEEEINSIRLEGLLHDLGKIGVPDTVLNKPGRLSAVEYQVIQSHTTTGSDILRNIALMPGAEAVARFHHERWDGKGYPDHISGERIPLHARVLGLADAYDAMNSDRIYRKALPADVIRQELKKGKGTQFDPELTDVFIELLDAGELVYLERRSDSTKIDDMDIDAIRHDVDYVLENLTARNLSEVGALAVGCDEFAHLLGYLQNIEKRYNHSFEVVLITVTPKDGELVSSTLKEEAMHSMELAVKKTVRNVDICTRYSSSQILCILLEVGNDNLDKVVSRIFLDFYKLFDGRLFNVSYEIIGKTGE